MLHRLACPPLDIGLSHWHEEKSRRRKPSSLPAIAMAWKLSSTTFVAWYGAAITCLDRGEIENWAIDGYWWLLMAIDGYWMLGELGWFRRGQNSSCPGFVGSTMFYWFPLLRSPALEGWWYLVMPTLGWWISIDPAALRLTQVGLGKRSWMGRVFSSSVRPRQNEMGRWTSGIVLGLWPKH